MAAELDRLITQYRRHGLHRAAEQLAVTKIGLQTRGWLPPSISVECWLPGTPGDATSRRLGVPDTEPQRRVVVDEYGHVSLLERDLDHTDRHERYEIDRLGLHRRHRNALIAAGFSTLADVQFGLDHGLLSRIPDISKRGAAQISRTLYEFLARRIAANRTSALDEASPSTLLDSSA